MNSRRQAKLSRKRSTKYRGAKWSANSTILHVRKIEYHEGHQPIFFHHPPNVPFQVSLIISIICIQSSCHSKIDSYMTSWVQMLKLWLLLIGCVDPFACEERFELRVVYKSSSHLNISYFQLNERTNERIRVGILSCHQTLGGFQWASLIMFKINVEWQIRKNAVLFLFCNLSLVTDLFVEFLLC